MIYSKKDNNEQVLFKTTHSNIYFSVVLVIVRVLVTLLLTSALVLFFDASFWGKLKRNDYYQIDFRNHLPYLFILSILITIIYSYVLYIKSSHFSEYVTKVIYLPNQQAFEVHVVLGTFKQLRKIMIDCEKIDFDIVYTKNDNIRKIRILDNGIFKGAIDFNIIRDNTKIKIKPLLNEVEKIKASIINSNR